MYNKTLDDLCFNVDEFSTQYLRLFFANATDPEDLWLGVASVGFKCANGPTAGAPTGSMMPPFPQTTGRGARRRRSRAPLPLPPSTTTRAAPE